MSEEFYVESGKVKNKLIIEWNQTEGAKDYVVQISSPFQPDFEAFTKETTHTVLMLN